MPRGRTQTFCRALTGGIIGVQEPLNFRAWARFTASDVLVRTVIRVGPVWWGPDVEKWQITKRSGSYIETLGSKTPRAITASHSTMDRAKSPRGFCRTGERTNRLRPWKTKKGQNQSNSCNGYCVFTVIRWNMYHSFSTYKHVLLLYIVKWSCLLRWRIRGGQTAFWPELEIKTSIEAVEVPSGYCPEIETLLMLEFVERRGRRRSEARAELTPNPKPLGNMISSTYSTSRRSMQNSSLGPSRSNLMVSVLISTCKQISNSFGTNAWYLGRRVGGGGERFRMYVGRRSVFVCTASESGSCGVNNSPASSMILPKASSATNICLTEVLTSSGTSDNVSHQSGSSWNLRAILS